MHNNVVGKFAALVFWVPLVFYSAGLNAGPSVGEDGASMTSLATVVERVTPGVVGVSVGQGAGDLNPLLQDPTFRRFFEEAFKGKAPKPGATPAVAVRPAGSGVVVDAQKGLVLTNHHVIQGASRLVVVLRDRRELPAELLGSDPGTDVAVLRVKADRLVSVALGNSDAVKVGDFVLAVGNPFGLGQTVTSGIVSALGRGISPEGYEDYIQTDAAINPGNSGGALINLKGELIGINTAIITGGRGGEGGGNIGIGFAVPTSMAREVMAQILSAGEVKRGKVGIQTDEITEDIAIRHGLPEITGALIRSVARGSSAERAGLKENDIVLQVDGRIVRTASDLRNRVALVPVGGFVQLGVWRDRQALNLRVAVEPVVAEQVLASQEAVPAVKGLVEQPSSKGGQAQQGLLAGVHLSSGRDGVVVNRVEAGSTAHVFGLRSGDVILAVNRQAMSSPAELTDALNQAGRKVLSILRGESKLRLTLG